MPKKSRRNRGKKKAAASEGAAASVPGEPEGVMETAGDSLYSRERVQAKAMWLYEWPPWKDRLMTTILDMLAADPRVHARFDRDYVSPKLLNMLETSAALIAPRSPSWVEALMSGIPDESKDAATLIQIAQIHTLLVQVTNYSFIRKEKIRPLETRMEFVKNITCDARSFVSSGRADVGAALYNFGLRTVAGRGFSTVFLIEWTSELLGAMKERSSTTASLNAFRDENAKRAMKIVAGNEDEPMHVRALASFCRACIAHGGQENDWVNVPCPVTATYLRRALLYERMMQEGEMRLPDLFETVDSCIEEVVTGNLEIAKDLLSTYCDAPNYLSIGGLACDHCGKTAEEAGLPCLHKCKQCRMAFYCSVECQAARWSDGGHREHCKKFGRFNIGDKLVLLNLKKRSGLNTSLVEVIGKTSPERLNVRICYPPQHEGTVVAVKKTNLRHHRPMK